MISVQFLKRKLTVRVLKLIEVRVGEISHNLAKKRFLRIVNSLGGGRARARTRNRG